MSLKIVHVVAALGAGGTETLVRDLSLAMVRQGHRVTIAHNSDAAQLGNPPAGQADMQRRLVEGGVDSVCIGHRAKRDPLFGARRLSAIMRAAEADIVHSHLQSGLLFASLHPWLRPTLFYTHHTDRLKLGGPALRVLTWKASGVVAISRHAQALLRPVVRPPVTLIPNAVPPAFQGRPPPIVNPGALNLIAVGRLTQAKDYPLLVAAVDRLLADQPDLRTKVRVDVFGAGEDETAITSDIDRRALSSVIRLRGLVHDIRARLPAYDGYLLTSRQEGLPIALLEAMTAGLPIVATRVGACPELVEPGTNGFLADPESVESVTAALADFCDAAGQHREMGRRSLERAEPYSLDESVNRHLALYEAAMCGSA